MAFSGADKLVINPRLEKNNPLFFSFLNTCYYTPALSPIKIEDKTTKTSTYLTLTHPIFRLEKPDRTNKQGQFKPKQTYYVVFEPEPLGEGMYGGVYPVIGTWRETPNGWVFKTKSNPDKQRLVKTNALSHFSYSSKELVESYKDEQKIGKYVPYMGFKYEPVAHKTAFFLLMRRQNGRDLNDRLANPNLRPLSVTERLQISIHVLKALEQLVQIKIPIPDSEETEYIVHRDFKPANLIVASNCSVKLIDFGMARTSTSLENTMVRGTPLYTDPLLYSSQIPGRSSHVSDYASAARVISDLWGDKGKDLLVNPNELHQRNKMNLHYGLLEGVGQLSQQERESLLQTLKPMNAYHLLDRLPKPVALERFNRLLSNRLQFEAEENRNNVTQKTLEELTSEALLAIFNSQYCRVLLARMQKNPSYNAAFIKTLGFQLLYIAPSLLFAIKKMGYSFSSLIIKTEDLNSLKWTAEQVSLLIQLGATLPVETFVEWIHTYNEVDAELTWVSLCRVLYHATNNREAIVSSLSKQDSFKAIFCHHFLTNNSIDWDDKVIVRVIKKHLSNLAELQVDRADIVNYLNTKLPNTAFSSAILACELMNPPLTKLYLFKLNLYEELLQFVHFYDQVACLKKQPSLKNRQTMIDSLHTDRVNRLELKGMAWEKALLDRDLIKARLQTIRGLDQIIEHLEKIGLLASQHNLIAELDSLYSAGQVNLEALNQQMFWLTLGWQTRSAIELIKKGLTQQGLALPKEAQLEIDFARINSSYSLNNAETLSHELAKYQQVYELMASLLPQLSVKKVGLDENKAAIAHQFLAILGENMLIMNVDELLLQCEQLKRFFELETRLLASTDQYPTFSSWLSVLLKNKIFVQGQRDAIKKQTIVFFADCLNRTLLFDLLNPAVLGQIDLFLRLENAVTDDKAYSLQKEQFTTDLWRYLSEPFVGTNQHKREFKQKLTEHIDALRDIRCDSLYSTFINLFFSKKPPPTQKPKPNDHPGFFSWFNF